MEIAFPTRGGLGTSSADSCKRVELCQRDNKNMIEMLEWICLQRNQPFNDYVYNNFL